MSCTCSRFLFSRAMTWSALTLRWPWGAECDEAVAQRHDKSAVTDAQQPIEEPLERRRDPARPAALRLQQPRAGPGRGRAAPARASPDTALGRSAPARRRA